MTCLPLMATRARFCRYSVEHSSSCPIWVICPYATGGGLPRASELHDTWAEQWREQTLHRVPDGYGKKSSHWPWVPVCYGWVPSHLLYLSCKIKVKQPQVLNLRYLQLSAKTQRKNKNRFKVIYPFYCYCLEFLMTSRVGGWHPHGPLHFPTLCLAPTARNIWTASQGKLSRKLWDGQDVPWLRWAGWTFQLLWLHLPLDSPPLTPSSNISPGMLLSSFSLHSKKGHISPLRNMLMTISSWKHLGL